MGWSHGGYITLLSVFRDKHPFKAAAAMVPVTNLVFRLSYKGPGYQRQFSTQARIQGLPFEKREVYIERSPLYHVDKLQVAAARARRDQRHRRELRRGSADRRRAALAQAGPRRDEGLRRSGARGRRAAATRSTGASNPKTLRARGFAGAERLVEPHLDVLRVAPAAVRIAASRSLRAKSSEDREVAKIAKGQAVEPTDSVVRFSQRVCCRSS